MQTRINNEHYKAMKKLLSSFGTHSMRDVLTDFVNIYLDCLMSDHTPESPYEQDYMRRIKGYTRGELDGFAAMMAEMRWYMQDTNDECLCTLYEEFCSSKELGQFFTPTCICDLMARITIPEIDWSSYTRDNMCWISDPCVGGGRLLWAAIKSCPQYQRGCVVVHGIDVDWNACKVAALNLVHANVNGYICHGDALSLEVWHVYELTHSFMGGGIREITDEDEMKKIIAIGLEQRQEAMQKQTEVPQLVGAKNEGVEFKSDSKGQLFFW